MFLYRRVYAQSIYKSNIKTQTISQGKAYRDKACNNQVASKTAVRLQPRHFLFLHLPALFLASFPLAVPLSFAVPLSLHTFTDVFTGYSSALVVPLSQTFATFLSYGFSYCCAFILCGAYSCTLQPVPRAYMRSSAPYLPFFCVAGAPYPPPSAGRSKSD